MRDFFAGAQFMCDQMNEDADVSDLVTEMEASGPRAGRSATKDGEQSMSDRIFHEHPNGNRCWWVPETLEWRRGNGGDLCDDHKNAGPRFEETEKFTSDARPEFEQNLDGILHEVRELMIDRHKKYGPGNISRHGLLGIRVRMDDKAERIDNSTADHADESYRDAWLDCVGYSLIGVLYLDGKWPGSKTGDSRA